MHMAFLSRVFKNLQWYGMTEEIPVISMVTGIFLPSFFKKTYFYPYWLLSRKYGNRALRACGTFPLRFCSLWAALPDKI